MEPIRKIPPQEFQKHDSENSITEKPSTTGSLVRMPLDQQVVAKALVVLATYFPNIELTRDKVAIYHEALKNLTEEQLRKGIKIFCLAHEEIYPGTNVIAKIRKFALGQHQYETAAEAWGEVFEGAKRGGIGLNNPISDRVVKYMGGWHQLGRSGNVEADRAHFMRMYSEILEKEKFLRLAGEI